MTFDPGDGRGPRAFVVPNIDFGAAAAAVAADAGACLHYDVPVTLTGRITAGKAFGELTSGGVGWTHWRQITLDRSICTVGIPDNFDGAEQHVSAMELVWDKVGSIRLGERETLTGTLFHADNGNQMTTVLFRVE